MGAMWLFSRVEVRFQQDEWRGEEMETTFLQVSEGEDWGLAHPGEEVAEENLFLLLCFDFKMD